MSPDLFSPFARRRAVLFYLASYIIKFNKDENFLSNDDFKGIRNMVLGIFKTMSYNEEGKFCGFAWFIVPKLLINQKYRIRRQLRKESEDDNEEEEERKKDESMEEDDEEAI